MKLKILIILQCVVMQAFSQGEHPYIRLSNNTKAVVQRFLDLSASEKYDELESIFTDSTTLIDYNAREIPGYNGSWTGPEIVDMMKQVSGRITDKKETILNSFVSGSYLTMYFEMEYTQLPTKEGGKPVKHKAQGVKVFHVIQGKIIKIDEYLDYFALFKQSPGR